MRDWRDAVLAGMTPLHRPGGDAGAAADSGFDAVRIGQARIGAADVVVAAWDFSVVGGSFGEQDATSFAAACAAAAATGRPLVTLLRSGGTRLQQGMRALVGIPRAMLALDDVAAAHVPHVTVVDHPTTGGVWVAIGAHADVRLGVAGATVGFSGPRVIEAMTGVAIGPGANTAETAAAAGLLDAVVDSDEMPERLEQVVAALAPDDATPLAATPAPVGVPDRSGWEQVVASREGDRADGAELLDELLPESVALEGIDDTVAVRVGRLIGRRVIGVAMTAHRERRVTIGGYQLVIRAARLAARLDIPLVVLVDTPGADPLPASEQGGIAALISAASRAVLGCTAPTVAVVHGAGGSGGALAGAVTDVVGVTETGWFAALGPEGAAATLRRPVDEVADAMGVTPRELLASGFADALAPSDATAMGAWIATHIDTLRAGDPVERLARRRQRWRAPLGAAPARTTPNPPQIG